MDTIYDWLSLAIFAGLIVLFLQRSTSERSDDVSLLYYLGAGVGCAVANYFGNKGQNLIAIALLVATIGFIAHYLKPFQRPSP